MERIIKAFFSIFFVIFFLSFSLANYSDYLKELESLSISVEELKNKESISRYELAKFFNLVDCFDCRYPSYKFKEQFNKTWFQNFLQNPGENFGDISFENAYYNGKNYYYCVAYAGYKDYMNGYPEKTSSICKGEFCGTNYATFSEILQVGFNILSQKIYSNYSANWQEIKDRLNSLQKSSFEYKNLNQKNIDLINENAVICKDNCYIDSPEEFKTYVKYCSFNLDKCGFENLGGLEEGERPVGVLNVLKQEKILNDEQIESLDFNTPINGKQFLEFLYRLSLKNTCHFDDDYDKDGIKNRNDNCLYTYNPQQKDLDNDGKGNVCDGDIDGDGLENPVGVVDDQGNLNNELLPAEDPCIFDSGNNCDNQQSYNWPMYIQGNPLEGEAPLNVDFQAITQISCDSVIWNFDDGNWGKGKNVSHIYTDLGVYEILAKCKRKNHKDSTARLTIKVGDNDFSKIAFQGKAYPLFGIVPLDAKLWGEYYGNIENIGRKIKGYSEKIVDADKEYNWKFPRKGFYSVEAKAYNNRNEQVGISKFNIKVSENKELTLGSNLRVDNLRPFVGNEVNFVTKYKGFGIEDVEKILWDFGEGETVFRKSFNISKIYTSEGNKLVKQKIYLKDSDIVMENILSIYVSRKNKDKGKGIDLKAEPLVQKVGKNFRFELETKGINVGDIQKMNRKFGDGNNSLFNANFQNNRVQYYGYSSPGDYKVRVEIFLKNSEYFISEASVTAKGEKRCKGDISAFDCDMDGDGVPDICDKDIDGDGIENLLGLIKFEKKDCKIDSENLDNKRLEEEYDLSTYGNDIDNCPFSKNPEQMDIDSDGKGDVCDEGNKEFLDSDGDGIPDKDDVCPNVPENFDGKEDEDGCPEISPFSNKSSYVEIKNCNTCPCHSADFGSQLWKGDKIRALLLDPKGEKIYKYSPKRKINNNINLEK